MNDEHSYYKKQIRIRMQPIKWRYFQWPRVTSH